jgi:hypothetical protein
VQKIKKQLLFVLDGLGLAEGLALVGAADAVVLVAVAVADLSDAAEVVACSGVEDLLGEAEAVCVGLAEALVAAAEEPGSVAETATVRDAVLTVELPVGPAATTLPAGAPSLPPPALPYSRNATTMMPAKPPVSISPIPCRFSPRRSARERRDESLSSWSSPTEMPRRPPPADLGALSSRVESASETADGIRSVERPSCALESSNPVAPQPGQDTAPLRCLRQFLQ